MRSKHDLTRGVSFATAGCLGHRRLPSSLPVCMVHICLLKRVNLRSAYPVSKEIDANKGLLASDVGTNTHISTKLSTPLLIEKGEMET